MERLSTTRSYDLVVIGAGPAGESAAELASFLGHSVVIVEKNKPGGVVATTGGAPSADFYSLVLFINYYAY